MFVRAINGLVIGVGVGVTGSSVSVAVFTGEENNKGQTTNCDEGNGN